MDSSIHDMSSKHTMHQAMMDHGDSKMRMCKMSMMLNYYYEDLCILTPHWMISTKFEMFLSMIALAVFTMGYEVLQQFAKGMEGRYVNMANSTYTSKELKNFKLKLSIIYAFSVLYSFVIMLLFMSFNVWIMLAVCIGAGIGHYLFNNSSETAITLNCH